MYSYCGLLFVVILGLVQINHAEPEKVSCVRLYGHTALSCCKNLPTIPMTADVRECLKQFPLPKGERRPPVKDGDKPPPPPPCVIDKCVGLRQGYINEAGAYLKDGLQSALDRQFQELPQIKKDIEDHCINGDINTYAPEDFCDGIKVKHCLHAQFLKACTNWGTEGECPEIKNVMEDCRSRI